ncbi:type II toxin-antitoxin system VapB family antitoxin [Novosphingobium sp. NDB2Meth1]|uniref:type II toxin-antitoxin system VapB family antitoxin n=1 Tax=Novosphingobium sp. NDB2Meth1 TaxID=1892847 RepID=UPI0009308198|nr:type II toxin-antitoxin system VapB family antitoxin [Novosphingobium sp. NDB2Meth1]
MGAQMNIKNAEAAELASKLAAMEGKSVTQVVLDALRARERELTAEDRFARAMAICTETAARLSPEMRALDIDDFLYDEYGLPK